MSVSVGFLLGVEAPTVAHAAGVSRSTVTVTVAEMELPSAVREGRSRRIGGGRKSAADSDPGLVAALDALLDPETRGDPESPLRRCRQAPSMTPVAIGQPLTRAVG